MWDNRGTRKLPEINIGGTMFYLDLRLNEFREVTDFSNRIDLDLLIEKEDGYHLLFDPVEKNIFSGTEEQYQARRESLQEVILPSLQEMDPLGFSMMIGEWKKDNPLLSAMIENIPSVLNDKDLDRLLPVQDSSKKKGPSF